jgi:hypothetical protein
MAAKRRPELVNGWPYEYKGWRITFYLEVLQHPLIHIAPYERWRIPLVEHLAHEKQSVRWTKYRKKITLKDLTNEEGYPDGTEERLCCFQCATYMPDEVWAYFEKCKEMTRCVNQ